MLNSRSLGIATAKADQALGEKRAFDMKGGEFRDTYDVFGVHVYKITRP